MRPLRNPLPLAILAAGIFAAMVALDQFWFRPAAGDRPPLDTRLLGFSLDEASEWLTALGPQGREALIVWHYLTLDLVFPALFSLALAGLLLRSMNKLGRFDAWSARSRTLLALAVPAPYALADYGQNLLVLRMLAAPTDLTQSLVTVTSMLIILKFVFLGLALVALLAAIIAARLQS